LPWSTWAIIAIFLRSFLSVSIQTCFFQNLQLINSINRQACNNIR
jgi:hypothetical protein